MLPAKKARSAARAKKRSLADDHGEQPEPAQQAAFAGGVAPGAAAQLTGLMPVAVVFFTGLALASLWRTPNQCSEGAKSLIQLELCPDELRLAGITQPPTFSSKPGQTPFWREAKDWAKKQWLVEAVGYDAVLSALADGKLDNMYERQRRKWNYARQKILDVSTPTMLHYTHSVTAVACRPCERAPAAFAPRCCCPTRIIQQLSRVPAPACQPLLPRAGCAATRRHMLCRARRHYMLA